MKPNASSSLTLPAYAKINLSLDVLSKRTDGYHDLLMIMQSVSLCDDVTVSLNGRGAFLARSDSRFLPRGWRNLALRACKLFLEHIGDEKTGVTVSIAKRIPVCAGLGGGSADAAAALLAMNSLTGAMLDEKTLSTLALAVGSDVPFCLTGGAALAEGRGEILTPLPAPPPCDIIIAKPALKMSTPELFSRLDCSAIKRRPDTDGLIRALYSSDLAGLSRLCFNIFEATLPETHEKVLEIKRSLLAFGALGAAMSGTGPSVFGIFQKNSEAKKAAEYLRTKYKEVFVTDNR